MGKIITVENFEKSYGSVKAVKGISFSVEEGSLFAFLGPNGAGKSTTIDTLCTLLKCQKGTITIAGHTLGKEDIRKIVGILLKNLEARCCEQLQIDLKVSAQAKDLLADAGMDQKYGARPLKRAIQTKLEDVLSNEILEGRIHRGDTVRVGVKDSKFVFRTDK